MRIREIVQPLKSSESSSLPMNTTTFGSSEHKNTTGFDSEKEFNNLIQAAQQVGTTVVEMELPTDLKNDKLFAEIEVKVRSNSKAQQLFLRIVEYYDKLSESHRILKQVIIFCLKLIPGVEQAGVVLEILEFITNLVVQRGKISGVSTQLVSLVKKAKSSN